MVGIPYTKGLRMKNKNFIEGVNILNKYCEDDSYSICAEHDEIYYHTDYPTTEDDHNRLLELGWNEVETNCYNTFV